MNGQFKDLRKAAFAVSFGVAMGKFAAEMAQAVITGIGLGTLKFAAKEGNEIAQEVCEKAKIKVEPEENKENESEEKVVMGFHCK
jgi:hypothetical protein